MSGYVDILRSLHEAGVDLNEGHPVEAAIGVGDIEAVRYLLSLGVDTSFIDTAHPIKPWKGSMATQEAMEELRSLISKAKTESGPRE